MLYSVLNSRNEIDALSSAKLDMLAFFSDDDISWRLVWQVLEAEYAERLIVGDQKHQFSQVTSTILNAAIKRSQQVWVAGLVALAQFAIWKRDGKTSQRKASEAVSNFSGFSPKETFAYFDVRSGRYYDKQVRVQSDPDSIRQVFRKYRNAAHICAARVCLASQDMTITPFAKVSKIDQSYLATTVFWQSFFKNEMSTEWNLREVTRPRSLVVIDHAVFPPDALLSDLLN